jgi:hypothetical protein
VREFSRSFSVYEWEIEQAAALGWIHIAARKLLLRVLGRVGPGRGAGKGGVRESVNNVVWCFSALLGRKSFWKISS